jgi:hypothetical protein
MPTEPKKHVVPHKSTALVIEKSDSDSEDEALARVVTDGISSNAITITAFTAGAFGETSLMACIGALRDKVGAAREGNLLEAETLLTSQASTLNVIFAELARRSALIMDDRPEASERYLRLALKAQNQCRTTLETLAAMKNPPMIFAKQANIANGHQQVNNGTTMPVTPLSAGENEIQQNELLTEEHHGETVDTRATGPAIRANSAMETVGAVNRRPNTRGQGSGST